MPLGKHRQRSEKPSSDGLLKDELYAQLLQSLIQGNDPLPTEEEYRRWKEARAKAYPDEQIGYEDERLPWPIRRYLARQLLSAFSWERWLPLQQAIHEDDDGEGLELDVEKVKADWIQWRTETIRRYRLEALVTLAEI